MVVNAVVMVDICILQSHKKWLTRLPRVDTYIFFIYRKNTNEQRVIRDYVQGISKVCRLWVSKTYTAKVINSH
jgi:hypothetical protein